jgi:putative DNA primase/helicase
LFGGAETERERHNRLGTAQLVGDAMLSFPHSRAWPGTGRWPLIGKMLAVIADALRPQGRRPRVAEHLLSISGGDPQTSTERPSILERASGGKFLITTNEPPAIADASGTLSSRFNLLKLTESFFGREDVDLKHKLA